MEREQIVRDDFPTTRKGWDPDAVKAHLEGLAEELPTAPSGIADRASQRVGSIVAAAEATAAEIETEARKEAEGQLEAARAEAEAVLTRARGEARDIVERAKADAGERAERAQQAVQGLLGQAEELRERFGSLGEQLTGEIRERVAEVPSPGAFPRPGTPDPDAGSGSAAARAES